MHSTDLRALAHKAPEKDDRTAPPDATQVTWKGGSLKDSYLLFLKGGGQEKEGRALVSVGS